EETTAFCTGFGIVLAKIQAAQGFEGVRLIDEAVDAILAKDENKKKYLSLSDSVDRLFKAILPDVATNEFGPARKLFSVLAQKIRSLTGEVDISEVMQAMEDLLDGSVSAEGYVIRPWGSD